MEESEDCYVDIGVNFDFDINQKMEKEKEENIWRRKLMVTPTNRLTG